MHGEEIARLVSLIFAVFLGVPGWVLFYLSSRRMTGKVAWAIRLVVYACLFMIAESIVRNTRTVFMGLYAHTFYIYVEETIYILAYILFFTGSYTLYQALQLVSNLEESNSSPPQEETTFFLALWKPFLAPFLWLKKLPYKLALRLKKEGWVAG